MLAAQQALPEYCDTSQVGGRGGTSAGKPAVLYKAAADNGYGLDGTPLHQTIRLNSASAG